MGGNGSCIPVGPLSSRTLELAGRVASSNGAVQAGFANIDTLAELPRGPIANAIKIIGVGNCMVQLLGGSA